MATPTSRIKTVHTALLATLTGIALSDPKNQKFKYINIWDDQIDEMIKGTGYSFGTPAVFIEVIPGQCDMMGAAYTSYPEFTIRFHIVNLVLNTPGGTMEQNLQIFDIRDSVKNTVFPVNYCSSLACCEDKLDYKHGNIYVYILSYKTNFIDSKGSVYDPNSGWEWGYLANPTINLNIYQVWFSGELYTSMINAVTYQNNIYLCGITNSDTVFNPLKWVLIPVWQPSTAYIIGNYAAINGHIYQCAIANNDAIFNPANWTLIL